MECDLFEACVVAAKRRVVELFEGGCNKYDRLFAKTIPDAPVDWRSGYLLNGHNYPESDDTTPESNSSKKAFDVAQVSLYDA